jgi:hypothetical protein
MRRVLAATFILITFAPPAAFAYPAAELPAKNVAAKGGMEKLRMIRSLRLEGRMLLNDDTLELAAVMMVKVPGSIRYEATLQGLTQAAQ